MSAIIFVPYCKGSSAYTYISIDAGTRKGTLGMAIINKGENKACNLCRRHGIAADRGCRKNVRTRVLTYRHWEP